MISYHASRIQGAIYDIRVTYVVVQVQLRSGRLIRISSIDYFYLLMTKPAVKETDVTVDFHCGPSPCVEKFVKSLQQSRIGIHDFDLIEYFFTPPATDCCVLKDVVKEFWIEFTPSERGEVISAMNRFNLYFRLISQIFQPHIIKIAVSEYEHTRVIANYNAASIISQTANQWRLWFCSVRRSSSPDQLNHISNGLDIHDRHC